MSSTTDAPRGAARPPRVRELAREQAAVMAFSLALSLSLALTLLLLVGIGR